MYINSLLDRQLVNNQIVTLSNLVQLVNNQIVTLSNWFSQRERPFGESCLLSAFLNSLITWVPTYTHVEFEPML